MLATRRGICKGYMWCSHRASDVQTLNDAIQQICFTPNATFMEIPIFHLELHRNKSWIFHPAMLDGPSLDRKGLTVWASDLLSLRHSTVVFKTHFYKQVTDVSLFVPKPSFASKSTSRFGGVFVQQVSYRLFDQCIFVPTFAKEI